MPSAAKREAHGGAEMAVGVLRSVHQSFPGRGAFRRSALDAQLAALAELVGVAGPYRRNQLGDELVDLLGSSAHER